MTHFPPLPSAPVAPAAVRADVATLTRQHTAAVDARAALLELLDALYRLTADMARDDSSSEAADGIRFAAAVRDGLTPEQCERWLTIRAEAVPALDVLLALFRSTLHSAPADFADMLATVEQFAGTREAVALAHVDGFGPSAV